MSLGKILPSATLACALSVVLAGNCAFAQGERDADAKALGRIPEKTRIQEKGLRPPDEVKNEKETEAVSEDFQPKGVELGLFLLMPKFEADAFFNDNIYAKAHDTKNDEITTLRPELALRSRFEEHALNFLGRVERKEYARFDTENVTDYQVQTDGRLDISKTAELNAFVGLTGAHEDRGSPDEAGGIHPTPTQTLTNNVSAKSTNGPIISILSGSAVDRTFEDVAKTGGIALNHLRNRWEYEEKLHEAYELVPGYYAIAEGSVNQRRYDNGLDANGFNRDSNGWRVNTGLGLDISQVIRGDVMVGYMAQTYKDARLSNPAGFGAKMSLNWTPSKLTVLVPSIERSIEETTASNVSALVRTSAALYVRHELQRNIILSNSVSYSRDTQKGGDDVTDNYEDSLKATYMLNPWAYFGGELGWKRKMDNATGGGFSQHTALIRLGLQM